MRQSRLTGELTPPLHHFVREQEEQPSSTCRFGMAEQAINTIYLLGEQPDLLCSDMLKHLTANVFITPPSDLPNPDGSGMGMDEDSSATLPSTPLKNRSLMPETPFTVGAFEPEPTPSQVPASQMSLDNLEQRDESATPVPNSAGLDGLDGGKGESGDTAPAFKLAQLVFAVGHTAVKHIVYLELVEREFKRRKDANAKGTSVFWSRRTSYERLRCFDSREILVADMDRESSGKGGGQGRKRPRCGGWECGG